MSKLSCPCGHEISDVAVPNWRKYWLLSDAELDGASSLDQLDEQSREVFVCAQCRRLLVQWDDREEFSSYVPERRGADEKEKTDG